MLLPELQQVGRPERPVYRQIADHIRSQVEGGALVEGARLPPIRSLARDLGVNRDTVAIAYEALASEGWVESVVGRGTFVLGSAATRPVAEPAAVRLSPTVERLLEFENARSRFGVSEGVVPLHSLIPDPDFYPVEAFRKSFNRALASRGPDLFLYGAPQGHPELRELLARRFARQGMRLGADDIVLCHGASQGISLAVRLLAAPGEAVAVEVPTYHNILATLISFGIEAVPVPMTAEGPDLAVLDRVLARRDVKAFYTIPTFHNPMGTSTSLPHRKQLLAIAERHATPILEDAFESDLGYDGKTPVPLAALDGRGMVVHLSSFSKTLFPGVRVGSIAARGRLSEALVALKHASDLSDSMPLQAALADFLGSGGYERHLARLRRALRERRDAMLEALEAELPAGTRWTRPRGGYQVWVELPFDVDTRSLLSDAAREGVSYAPGSQFLPDRGPSRAMRLTVARAGPEAIGRGVAALGRVVRRHRAAEPARREAASVDL